MKKDLKYGLLIAAFFVWAVINFIAFDHVTEGLTEARDGANTEAMVIVGFGVVLNAILLPIGIRAWKKVG